MAAGYWVGPFEFDITNKVRSGAEAARSSYPATGPTRAAVGNRSASNTRAR